MSYSVKLGVTLTIQLICLKRKYYKMFTSRCRYIISFVNKVNNQRILCRTINDANFRNVVFLSLKNNFLQTPNLEIIRQKHKETKKGKKTPVIIVINR